MGVGGGYFAVEAAARPALVRLLRVLLWAEAAVTAVMVVAGLVAAVAAGAGSFGAVLGGLAAMAWPGVVACRVADGLWRPSPVMFGWLLAGAFWQVVLAAGQLGGGDPRGATSLLLPLAVVVLVCTRPVRAHLRGAGGVASGGRAAADGGGGGPGGSVSCERGAGVVEYAALVAVAALVLGALVALGLPSRVGGGVQAAVCTILNDTSCEPATRRPAGQSHDPTARSQDRSQDRSQNPAGEKTGRGPAGENPRGDRGDRGEPGDRGERGGVPGGGGRAACHGALQCAWRAVTTDPYELARRYPCRGVVSCIAHGAGIMASSQWNLDKAIIDDAEGLGDLALHPGSLKDAASYIRHHPWDAARRMIWDDQSTKLWHNGNHVGAATRTLYNIGSWFIPGPDLLKATGKLGKLGKAGRAADKTAELSRLSRAAHDATTAADRAQRLATKGDYDGARRAANKAHRKADQAKTEARKKGCRSAGLALPGPAVATATLAALPAHAPDDDPCKAAADAEQQADNAEKAANKAYRSPDPGTPEYDHRLQELAKDPAKSGAIGRKSRREAEVALDLERRGDLPGPVKRQPLDNSDPSHQSDLGDYVDADGQRWDVKGPTDTFPDGPRAGQKMPEGQKGRYERSRLENAIGEEIAHGQHVILDTRHLSPAALRDVHGMVASHSDWMGKVIFH